MPRCRSFVTGVDHFDVAFIIDVGKLIHFPPVYVLQFSPEKNKRAIFFASRNNLTIIFSPKSDLRAVIVKTSRAVPGQLVTAEFELENNQQLRLKPPFNYVSVYTKQKRQGPVVGLQRH